MTCGDDDESLRTHTHAYALRMLNDGQND